jgi:GT2 family glycosyltransferase
LSSTFDQPTLAVFASERDCCWVAAQTRAQVGGLEPVNVFDGYGVPARRNGLECLSFHNPYSASQAYFAIDRAHGFTRRGIEVEMEVFVGAEGGAVRLEYDSTDLSVWIPPHVRGAFKATPAQDVAAGSDWRSVRFTIDDPRFCRSVHGADFRVVSAGASGQLELRSVRVALREGDRSVRGAATSAALSFDEVADPQVSIIIPTRDRLELLRQCLESLRANTPPIYELIVVDDGSSQGVCEALRSVAGLRLVRLPVNVGFARACNAGAARARAPLLLFLNNDTVPLTGWLKPMLVALERDSNVGVVGSRLLYPRLGLVQHAGIEIDGRGLPFHRHRLEPSEALEVNEDRILPAVTGACLLVRRSLFETLRGFDIEFRNGYEDVDLCLRARDHGFLTLYCNRSILLHYESASEGRTESESANARHFLSRWGSPGVATAGSSEGRSGPANTSALGQMTENLDSANRLVGRSAIFLHIQKTAGTSIADTVRRYYANSMASHGDFMNRSAESMQHYRFVSGHFGFEFARALVETRYSFTFLRDPVERVLSLYYFARNRNPQQFLIYRMAQELDLHSFLLAGRASGVIRDHIYNHQTWQLSWGWGAPHTYTLDNLSDEQMLALAKANIEKFSYVGFAETFDDDCRRVLADLGIPAPEKVVHVNATPSRPHKESIPSETLTIIRELTACDQVLYDTAWALRRDTPSPLIR